MESAIEHLDVIKESIKEKGHNLLKNITTSLNKAITLLTSFIKKVINIKDRYVIDEKFVQKVIDHKFSEKCVNEISNIIEERKRAMPRLRINGNRSYHVEEGFVLTESAKHDIDFAVTMIQKSIIVSSDKNAINIYDITKELHGLIEILKAGNKISDRMMEDIVHTVDQNRKHANIDGITIDFELARMEDVYKELESYGDISKLEGSIQDIPLDVYSKTIGRVMPTIGDTLDMYNAVLTMRMKFKELFQSCVK